MNKRMLFIYNPVAGKGKVRNNLSAIIERFAEAGYEITIYPTKEKFDARHYTAGHAQKYDLIVCCGGDGTLNEVTDGLMLCEQRPPCGYIPAGTINDFASSLKLSKNMKNAAITVLNGTKFYYDIGSLNDEFFTYYAGFGAFTDVSYETPQATKNILGRMAYFLEGVKRLPGLKSYHMEMECDGEYVKDEFIYGMITNSNSIGGFKQLSGKDVKLDDGLFEVAFIKMPKNPLELQSIINALLMREINNKYIYTFLAANIKVRSEELVPWSLDGEYGGDYTEIEINNNRQAICYIIDNKKEPARIECER